MVESDWKRACDLQREDEVNEKRREEMLASDMAIAVQYQEAEMRAAGIRDLEAHFGMAGSDGGVGKGAVPVKNVNVTSVLPLLPTAVKNHGLVLVSAGADDKQCQEGESQRGSGRDVQNPSHGQNNNDRQSVHEQRMHVPQESGRPMKSLSLIHI